MIKKLGIMLSLIISIFCSLRSFDCAYAEEYNLPFSDNANHPAGIYPGTVITTNTHGMWVVIQGSYISTGQRTEVAYFYQEAGKIRMSYTASGTTVTVIAMPDPSPIVSVTTNPIIMQPGTVLVLDNGQIWKITGGSYMALTSTRQTVVVYERSGTNYLSFQISGTTLEVELLSEAYTLTLTKSGSGSGRVYSSPSRINCGSTCSASYTSGTLVTLTATPDSGSYFTGWSGGGCSGTGTCNVTMNDAATVTAMFTLNQAQQYTLTLAKSGTGSGAVISSPSGINCGDVCTASFASGTLITLTANPTTGSLFTSWSGCDSPSGTTCTLSANGTRQVTATFSSTSSSSAYFNTVQKLYIGYYQRPADPEGLLFWARGLQSVDVNGDGSFDGENFMWVLEQFAFSAESRKIYGGDINSTNIANVIDSIYMGLFNRHAESGGLAFWVNSFNTGASTPASILWEVMKGAQGTDRDTLNNKVTGSNRLTHVIDPELDGVSNRAYPSWAGQWLSAVTYDTATIPTEEEIEGLF